MAVFILITFIVFCVGALVQPRWSLALLLLMYPLEQAVQGSVPLFIENPSWINYIVGIVVAVSTVLGWLQGKINTTSYFNLVSIAFISGYAYSFISYLWTPSQDKSWTMISEGCPYFVMYIIIAPLLIGDIKDWNRVLLITMVFGLATSIAILLSPSFTLTSGRLGFNFTSKIRSSPLAIGELGGFLILTSSLLMLEQRRYWIIMVQILSLVCGIILSVFSGSRGQFFFSVFLVIIFFPLSRPIKNLSQFFLTTFGSIALLLIIIIIGYLLLGDVDITNRWLSGQKTEEAIGVRMENFVDLLNGFMRRPSTWLLGQGVNAFTSISNSQEPYSHIMFLDVLVEMGLLAVTILIVCLFSIFNRSRELLLYTSANPQLKSSAVVLLALCSYQLLLMNKQGELWSSEHTIVYFLLLVKVALSTQIETKFAESIAGPESA